MKKLLLLMVVVIVIAVVLYRQRLFLRDPLGRVFVGESELKNAQVFINYTNDVLVMRDGAPYVIVQNWDRTPGEPQQITCLRTLGCLTDSEQAAKAASTTGGLMTKAEMTNREVTYPDGGKRVRVVIR